MKNNKNPQTRARKTLPVYESIQHCSGATGIPAPVLKAAKRAGCPAFISGNRIDLAGFLGWYWIDNPDREEVMDVNKERALLLREQRIAQARQNKVIKCELYDRDNMDRRFLDGILLSLRQTFEPMPASLAPMVNPNDPLMAKKVLLEWWERAKAQLRGAETQLTPTKDENEKATNP